MLIDVISLITPNAAGLGNNYLQDTSSGGTPSVTYVSKFDSLGFRDLYYMKSLKGYPWDGLKIGPDFVREILTELKWTQPNTGKLNVGTLASAVLGARRFPRWIDYTYPTSAVYQPPSVATPPETPGLVASLLGTPVSLATPAPIPGQWQFTIARPETDYVIIDSLDTTAAAFGNILSRNTDDFVRLTFMGPFVDASLSNSIAGSLPSLVGAATGDIPAGEDWILVYEWGGHMVNGVISYQGVRERVYHRSILMPDGSRRGYGRYSWDTAKWAGSSYGVVTASSLSNKIMPMPATAILPVQKLF